MSNILKFGASWHSLIPNEFIQCPFFSHGAFRLFVVIVSYASPSSPRPFPGWSRLSKNLNCCHHSIGKWLNELEKSGWIRRDQQTGKDGRFAHNAYTIYPDDEESRERRKQFSASPCVIPSHAVPSHAMPPHATAVQRKSTQSEKDYQRRKNTTNTRAADAAEGGGVDFLPASRASENGKDREEVFKATSKFLNKWQWGYQRWYGSRYHLKPGHQQLAEEVIGELGCRGKQLAAYAFKMWINTAQADRTVDQGFDPLFWQIKGSRDIQFFLKYIQKIANEMQYPLDANLRTITTEEYGILEETIGQGRPEPE